MLLYGNAEDVPGAAIWLCQKLGVEPTSLGWNGRREEHNDRVDSANNGETFDRGVPEGETKKQKKQGAGARPTQADVLIEIATGPDIALFHTPDGTAYVDIRVDGHRETWAVQSPGFKRRLRRAYFERTGGAPNNDALGMALAVIEARRLRRTRADCPLTRRTRSDAERRPDLPGPVRPRLARR